MPSFGSTINAQLAGADVKASILVSIDFTTTVMRLWLGGAGILSTPSPGGVVTWAGTGRLIDIDELLESVGDAIEPFDLTLSGVDEDVLTIVNDGIPESYDKLVVVYLQFFDDDWSPLDSPYSIAWGRTSNIIIAEDGGNDGSEPVRTVRAPIEPVLSGRSRPVNVKWSDGEQKRRYPGDRGCERMAVLTLQTVSWPKFS